MDVLGNRLIYVFDQPALIFNQPFPTLLESIRIAPPKKATTSVFGGMGWVEVGHEC